MFKTSINILFTIITIWISLISSDYIYAIDEERDSLTASSNIAMSGMQAQSKRLKVIAQNIANADVTGSNAEQDPYRRKVIFFKNEFDPKLQVEVVKVEKIDHDYSEFIIKYMPYHPSADQNGYVKFPNVNMIVEIADAKEAQRSFEANVNSLEIAKSNKMRVIDLMK